MLSLIRTPTGSIEPIKDDALTAVSGQFDGAQRVIGWILAASAVSFRLVDLIFLHGPAAAGKLTTAFALERLVGYPVFHNHLVVDTLTTVFPFGTEPFIRLRDQFWMSVFREAACEGRSIIFTFAPEPTVPFGFPERARALVEDEGGRVRFVRLLVNSEEQERRISAPSRRAFHKLTDVQTLRQLRTSPAPVEEPPAHVTIDTTTSPPAQSAAAIAAHFQLNAQAPQQRYPS